MAAAPERSAAGEMRAAHPRRGPLTDADVSRYRHLFGVDQETLALLAGAASLIDADVDAVVEAFYHRQLELPEVAAKIGAAIAERAKKAGVEECYFDRGGFLFHGKIKALADAAREGGLKF